MEIKSKFFPFSEYVSASGIKNDTEFNAALVRASNWLSDSSGNQNYSIGLLNIETVHTNYGEQCGIRVFYTKNPLK